MSDSLGDEGLGRYTTHTVINQVPPLGDHDVFTSDVALVEGIEREGAGAFTDELVELGRKSGSEEFREHGRLANEYPPVLKTHDRFGNRLDVVEYHPSYHTLMAGAIDAGIHAQPWSDERPGAHVARAAKNVVWYQVDAGHMCPVSMTYSVVPALRHQPELYATWQSRLISRVYDGDDKPGEQKSGITCGMAMTEKQGGSDVRANTTRARHVAGDEYELTGHKWFCSAPMSDAYLMLGYTDDAADDAADEALTCFWVPRWQPDGTRNRVRIQRLKDKLGDRSNASSEIELEGAWGHRVGEVGRGVPTIIEMVNHTRLDCILGSTAIMRQCVTQATWHTHHRAAFGKLLDDQPLMLNVLADLAIESEAATLAAMRLARAFDAPTGDTHEQMIKRLATPVIKYWTCKRAPQHAAEALECLGGNGFVEESVMPRWFRQSPVNGVWEGSGNVICLDVLRAIGRAPEALDVVLGELALASGADRCFDDSLAAIGKELTDLDELEVRARRLVERLATVFQASLLLRFSTPEIADAFCASRLTSDGGRAFGTLPPGLDLRSIVERARIHS